MKVNFKLPKILSFVIFLWLFLFLPIQVFGQTTAFELVKKIDEQLETGKVLQIMRWDPAKQEAVVFDPLVDSDNSPKNFSLEAGASYFILTDVKGLEFVDLPFEIVTPKIVDGWNLVSWQKDLPSKYNVQQITCFNPEFQQYEDVIVGFNNEILPEEGQGCWLYVGQGKTAEGAPHAIYGTVFLDGKEKQATISVINLTSGKQGITESREDGKFSFDLLNLGWKANDKILVSVSAGETKQEVFLDIEPGVPNQRIDINLEKPPKPVIPKPSLPKWKWIVLVLVLLFTVLGLTALIIKIIKVLKKKK